VTKRPDATLIAQPNLRRVLIDMTPDTLVALESEAKRLHVTRDRMIQKMVAEYLSLINPDHKAKR